MNKFNEQLKKQLSLIKEEPVKAFASLSIHLGNWSRIRIILLKQFKFYIAAKYSGCLA